MDKTLFKVPKMDCPSEEHLIQMKLEGFSYVKKMNFNIPNREVTIFHEGRTREIEESIRDLNLGVEILITEKVDQTEFSTSAVNKHQRKILTTVLVINFAFFLIEATTGYISKSMSLMADSLDMLADSIVYGLSLFAVGSTMIRKKQVALIAGYFQISLAVIGFMEVLRRFLGAESLPDFSTMIVVSVLSLIANSICLYLLQQSKSKEEVHIKASMIFTSNDVIINLGIIIAGLMVLWLDSSIPDLIVGTIVFIVVIRGAMQILKLGK